MTGIDIPDDLEDKIEDAVDDLAEDVLDKVEDVAEDVVDAVENAESIEDAVESVKDVIDVAVDDLEDLTVAGLKERLEELGLSTKGRKADLIARIKEHVEDPVSWKSLGFYSCLASVVGSIAIYFGMGDESLGIFVGLWAPPPAPHRSSTRHPQRVMRLNG